MSISIDEFCQAANIKSYKIDKKGIIVKGDLVFLEKSGYINSYKLMYGGSTSEYNLTEFPYKIHKVEGNFVVSSSVLNNIKNFPDLVKKSVILNLPNISNLENIPLSMKGNYVLNSLNIKNLIGLPNNVVMLTITKCKNLNSLEGIRNNISEITLSFLDNLINLKGLENNKPLNVYLWGSDLKNLEGLPEKINTLDIDISDDSTLVDLTYISKEIDSLSINVEDFKLNKDIFCEKIKILYFNNANIFKKKLFTFLNYVETIMIDDLNVKEYKISNNVNNKNISNSIEKLNYYICTQLATNIYYSREDRNNKIAKFIIEHKLYELISIIDKKYYKYFPKYLLNQYTYE